MMMSWRDNTSLQKKKKKQKVHSREGALREININSMLRRLVLELQSTTLALKISKKLMSMVYRSSNEAVLCRFLGLLFTKKVSLRDARIFKKFRVILKANAGRNADGKITVRHRQGGEYRSFMQLPKENFAFSDVPTRVINMHTMGKKLPVKFGLCLNNSGVFSYMLGADKLKKFANVFNSNKKMDRQMIFSSGSRTTLRLIPTGSLIYNVELSPNKGAQLARSAGAKIKLMLKKELYGSDYAGILLPSKKLIYVPLDCQASLGVSSTPLHKLHNIGLAGIRRKQGFRPSVRGVAMNPVDHHHGGGEGKTSSGPKPKTAWGKTWRYIKTRSERKEFNFKIFVSRMQKNGFNIASTKKYY